ncbi:outer membrane protein [Jiella marina]|uniref:outer membrane protein n=1 Tax=Jiella sp. LLJ827 TaxID=2917712 RepID=UPI002101C75A|nr:outer membrane beta-barrel protein [Jiella sp. LLJ827]MCQ0990263.1 outer membrane beta-barrel protein [Jiella sp. LLJ827]
MKKLLLTTVAALGAWSFAAPAAMAADIIEEPVYIAPPAPEPVVSHAGWYLRGDVGYNFKSKSSGDYDFWNPGDTSPLPYDDGWVRGIDHTEHYDEFSLRGSANFSAGVGYRFNKHFRTDLTVDYFKADMEGSSRCGYLVEIGYLLDPTNNDCRYNDSSSASVWTAMANAYVDIGTYGRITPYIGAGLGFAHVSYDEMKNSIDCTGGLCTGNGTYVGTHPGESSWRFASSLMAGATVDITKKLKFDAGYKYTRIAAGDAFGYDALDRSNGASGVQSRDHGFDIHTIKAGLRYEFGGGGVGFGKGKGKAPAPLYDEPAPIYADAPTYVDTPIYK